MKRLIGLTTTVLITVGLLLTAAVGAAPKQADRGAWAPGVSYAVGDTVTYNGVVYKCLQAHTSQTGWEPPNVPALWQAIGTSTPGGGATATRTPTRTNTPAGATATRTPTRTNTPSGATATRTPTRTNTPAGPTATPTRTNTPAVATNTPTRTNTPVAPTATRTNTPSGATATRTPTSSATPSPSSGGELAISFSLLSEDATSYQGKITFANPNTSYVWNGTYFAIWNVTFETTSQITKMTYPDGGSPTYTTSNGVVTVDLGWRSLFPYNTSVEVILEANKSGARVYPQNFKPHYVRGENIVYPVYQGLPSTWKPQKTDLRPEDLIVNPTAYYSSAAQPIQDKLIMYAPPSQTQIQIGLARTINYPVNGATDARVYIPTRYMAMGLGFALEEFNINPNYLAALGTKENWAAAVTRNPSFTGPKVVIDGEEWIWPIVIDHPDGPYQVEAGNFNDLVKFFPDYFPSTAVHDDYTKVSSDLTNPNWISSAITTAISLTTTREQLNAVPTADYTGFMAQARDPWAEMCVLTFAYNRGMGSLEAKKLFSTNRAQALNSTDICADFDMGGFASHVPTVRAITDAMNKETTYIYDAQLTWADVQAFFTELRTFLHGEPPQAQWDAMMQDVQRAYNVLAQHWGGSYISLRYDFLTLLRVAKQYRAQPYHPRPTGSDWYYRVKASQP